MKTEVAREEEAFFPTTAFVVGQRKLQLFGDDALLLVLPEFVRVWLKDRRMCPGSSRKSTRHPTHALCIGRRRAAL